MGHPRKTHLTLADEFAEQAETADGEEDEGEQDGALLGEQQV